MLIGEMRPSVWVDIFPGNFFQIFSGNFFPFFSPTAFVLFFFCFGFCWECFPSTRSSRKGRGRSAKASVMERKGGNSGFHWFRVSLGSVSCP